MRKKKSKLPNALPTFVQSTIQENMAKECSVYFFEYQERVHTNLLGLKKLLEKNLFFFLAPPLKTVFIMCKHEPHYFLKQEMALINASRLLNIIKNIIYEVE